MDFPHRARNGTLPNTMQLQQVADVFSDIAQVIFASCFMPFFFGESSVFLAFAGALVALLLWLWSISLLRKCYNS
jgi:hypothetical protein